MIFVRIKQLWFLLKLLFFSRKVWCWPRQSRVLIFDACNQEIIMEYFQPWHPEVLHVRGEKMNIKVLLKSLFRSGSRTDAYVDCFIEKVRPHLVVTLNDNHTGFYSIAVRNTNVVTIFIQNGMRDAQIFERLASKVSLGGSFKVNYMMTFGDSVGEEYAKYIQGCVILMGSLHNNNVPKLQIQQKGMIAFVSQWGSTSNPTEEKEKEYIYEKQRLVLQCLANYAKERNKRLMIILRNYKQCELLSQEKAYFRGLVGSEQEFYESKNFYSGYQAVDSAEVVVSLNSTLGFESIARGNKTAFFTTEGLAPGLTEYKYDWLGDIPDEGLFWTNRTEPDNFFRILDYLFEVDDVQWRKDVENTKFSSIMAYDPGNFLLKSILKKELGEPRKTKNITTSV
jgi:surface carbohydrate biosynthesis protein